MNQPPAYFWRSLSCVFLLATVPALHAQSAEWLYHKTADGQHPNGNEQMLLWLLNRARANPTAEGLFLANTGDANVTGAISYFGVNLNLMKSEFAALPATPPAAFDRRIYEGSRVHSQDMIARDSQDHTGQIQRVADAGFSSTNSTYSVYAYGHTPVEIHAALNIDWGFASDGMQPGRGHRDGIMGTYPNVGFAVLPDSSSSTSVGPLVFSGAYAFANTGAANHFNRFLTGTVWTDTNGNGRYDSGEGLNNVRVQPDSGPWHAITGVAGGWAIPVSAGTFVLTISGGALTNSEVRTVTVSSSSVLVDVKASLTPGPLQIQIAKGTGNNVVLTWSGGKAPFQVQTSTTLSATSWQNVGTATSNRTLTVTPSGTRAYYRVIGTP